MMPALQAVAVDATMTGGPIAFGWKEPLADDWAELSEGLERLRTVEQS